MCKRNKCDCRDGFFRNKHGKCVRWNECKLKIPRRCTNPCTRQNEISRCANPCTRRSCDTKDIKLKCNDECTQQCDCIPGYRRNDDSLCVPKNQCPKSPTKENPQ